MRPPYCVSRPVRPPLLRHGPNQARGACLDHHRYQVRDSEIPRSPVAPDATVGQTDPVDLAYRTSLLKRLRAVHSLYDDACDTMTLDQVNHVVAPTTLPIAFSLAHQVLIEDVSLHMAGGPPIRYDDHWRARLSLAIDDDGKARTVEEMVHQRIGDYSAFRSFQRVVFDASERYVATLDPVRFDDVLVSPPYGDVLERTFSARVGAEDGITRSDALECWIYQHALRHLGEIEHARSLVGLGGLTS